MIDRFATSPPEGYPRIETSMAVLALAVLAIGNWAPHLSTSLWLDETLTFWVIKDGFVNALRRGVEFQTMPAYYAFMWLWTQFAGVSEIALRLPSLVATCAACGLMAPLASRLTHDRETALLATVMLATPGILFRESIDARPYMLGLLVLVGLAVFLERWLAQGRTRDAVAVGILAATLPHFHLFLALSYPAFVLFAGLRWARSSTTLRQLGIVAGLLAIGGLCWIPVGQTLLAIGENLSFAPVASWSRLIAMVVWAQPVAGLLAATLIGGLFATAFPVNRQTGERGSPQPLDFDTSVLLVTWALFPLLFLFTVSIWSDVSVFLARYVIAALPAVAIAYAVLLRRVPSRPARWIGVAVIVLACFAIQTRAPEDFRGAVSAVNEWVAGNDSTPILLSTGLIESQHERWLRDPRAADYLQGPTAYYALDGKVVTLPRKIPGLPIADEILSPVLSYENRFAAIEWTVNGADVLSGIWKLARKSGFEVSSQEEFGGVRIATFERSGRR